MWVYFRQMAKVIATLTSVHTSQLISFHWLGFIWRKFFISLHTTSPRWWHPTPVLLPGKSHGWRSLVGCSPRGHEKSDTTKWLHFHFHAVEKEMATHSSVLAWRISGMGEPGGLLSMGLHRVGHDWSDLAAAVSVYHCTSLQLFILVMGTFKIYS